MSNDQMQSYNAWEQGGMLYQGFSDANLISSNFQPQNLMIPDETNFTSSNGTYNNAVFSSPEIGNQTITSPGKPKRRRSKNSPSQPTTFLNASIANFRALVQQHTGCHTNAATPKGPITLCFGSSTSLSHETS